MLLLRLSLRGITVASAIRKKEEHICYHLLRLWNQLPCISVTLYVPTWVMFCGSHCQLASSGRSLSIIHFSLTIALRPVLLKFLPLWSLLPSAPITYPSGRFLSRWTKHNLVLSYPFAAITLPSPLQNQSHCMSYLYATVSASSPFIHSALGSGLASISTTQWDYTIVKAASDLHVDRDVQETFLHEDTER